MTCQALGSLCFQVVGQLHTAMNQVGQSQTAPFETEDSSDSYNDRLTADS